METLTKNHNAADLLAEREVIARALMEAGERERRRIGEQLHDHLCQLLIGAAFGAKALPETLPLPSTAAAELDALGLAIMKYHAEATGACLRFDKVDAGGARVTYSLRKRE